MKTIVVGERVVDFIGERCGTKFHQPCIGIGIEENSALVAGALFNNHTKFDIEGTLAGDRNAFNRAFLSRIGEYVFNELGCLRLTITTHQDHVISLIHRLGGQTEGRKRNHFGAGLDGIVLGILREDWKFR